MRRNKKQPIVNSPKATATQRKPFIKEAVKALGIAAGMFGVGILLAWGVVSLDGQSEVQSPASTPATPSVEKSETRTTRLRATRSTQRPISIQSEMDAVLEDLSVDNITKCRTLIEIAERASPREQEIIAEHLVALADEFSYSQLADWLQNPDIPIAVGDVLMADLMQHENLQKLPILLKIAQQKEHPLRWEALDFLELQTEKDLGENWDAWNGPIQAVLQKPI